MYDECLKKRWKEIIYELLSGCMDCFAFEAVHIYLNVHSLVVPEDPQGCTPNHFDYCVFVVVLHILW